VLDKYEGSHIHEDLVPSTLFEAMFQFADRENKKKLAKRDLEVLFQTLSLPFGNANIHHVMTKYDSESSGFIKLEEFIHYMK
ncbi:unnamed protein product, partial [Choristocarpus tenellus]